MNVVVTQRDRHTLALFEDWCTALECAALPATPDILAHFFDAHPAAVSTQRRRLAIIDAVHHRAELAPPGRSETVRAALDAERAQRRRDLGITLAAIVVELPTSGWPAALFDRRDAVILVLASTGMPYRRIAELRVCDVSADYTDGSLRVKSPAGGDGATTYTAAMPDVVASAILTRWLQVLGHDEAHLSTRLLAEAMASGGGAELIGYERYVQSMDERPLLTPIDR